MLDLLEDDDITESLFGTGESAEAAKDVVKQLVENAKEDKIEDDIAAGQAVLDIVQKSQDGDKTLDENDADALVESLQKSDTIMDMLDQAAKDQDSGTENSLQGMIDGLDDAVKGQIADSASKSGSLTPEQKTIFDKLFGQGTNRA